MNDELGDLAKLAPRLTRLVAAVPVAEPSPPALGSARLVRSRQPLGLVGLSAGLVIVAILAVAIGQHTPPVGESSPGPSPSTSVLQSADVTSWYPDGLPMTISGEHVYRASEIAKLVPTGSYLVAAWDLGALAASCPAQIVGQSNPPCPRFESLADAKGGPQVLVAAWGVADAPSPTMVLRATTEPSPSCFSNPPGGCPTVPQIRVQAVVWKGQPSPSEPIPAGSAASTDGLAFWSAAAGLAVGSTSDGSGAVWRTSDGGRTWVQASRTPVPFRFVAVAGSLDAWGLGQCLSSDGAMTDCGVYRSSDGGATWRQVSDRGFSAISVPDGIHAFAVTGQGPSLSGGSDVFASDDGGATWHVLATGCGSIGWASAVSFASPTHGWLGCASEGGAGTAGKGVAETSDGGQTWSVRARVMPPGSGASIGTIGFGDYLFGLTMRSSGSGMIWEGRGGTLRTVDGGANWTAGPPGGSDAGPVPHAVSTPTDADWYALLWDPDAQASVVWASHDAGIAWSVVGVPGAATTATPVPTATTAAAPNEVDAGGSFGGGGLWATRSGILYISADGGRSWKASASRFTTPGACIDTGIGCGTPFVLDARHAWVINAGPGSTEFTGSQTDVLKLVLDRTTDGGATWSHVSIPGSYPGTTQSLVFVDADHGFLLCGWTRMSPTPSTVLRTDDGGVTWRVVHVGPPGGDTASLGSMLAASGPTTLWDGAEGDAGPVERALFDVSRDAGATWSRVTLPGLEGQLGGPINYLMAPPTFGPVGLVSVVSGTPNGNITRIYRSTDNGVSWSLASSLQREASANLLPLDASHWLLPVSNTEGLIATSDGGKTWQAMATAGLVSNWILSIAAANPSDLIAVVATGSSQPGPQALFVSHDGGRSWQEPELH